MKLSDEEIGALLQCLTSKPLDVTITQPVSNLMSVNIHDAIRQLKEERDRYREVLNKLMVIEPEKECYVFVGEFGAYTLNPETLEWNIAKQALGEDDADR